MISTEQSISTQNPEKLIEGPVVKKRNSRETKHKKQFLSCFQKTTSARTSGLAFQNNLHRIKKKFEVDSTKAVILISHCFYEKRY